jgi:hypothetical protein
MYLQNLLLKINEKTCGVSQLHEDELKLKIRSEVFEIKMARFVKRALTFMIPNR